ncbi:hypothetical protein PUNSTDRAFT_48143 [Punctularia strigosozonata HHB-11173 SS5]|uniref:Uncharacterized protein n=1 Tax=Punctularia strigosozonata (strain HHB-11173) TaxID=741275 RepID=R7S281_PUNST|nr:uncharacterized protein PUNSTDRAFT_48143 [Punctularia strigosozonata HHB-11173 SS5]EIN03351.1 hypothetical protein PUNSTDRAFT_48143 [Punctularia strigosozonata HHB-11173 SS5]
MRDVLEEFETFVDKYGSEDPVRIREITTPARTETPLSTTTTSKAKGRAQIRAALPPPTPEEMREINALHTNPKPPFASQGVRHSAFTPVTSVTDDESDDLPQQVRSPGRLAMTRSPPPVPISRSYTSFSSSQPKPAANSSATASSSAFMTKAQIRDTVPLDLRWYSVTVGSKIGVVQGWDLVREVASFPGSKSELHASDAHAWKHFYQVLLKGSVRVLIDDALVEVPSQFLESFRDYMF